MDEKQYDTLVKLIKGTEDRLVKQIKETNKKLDSTNERLEQTNERIDSTNERISEMEERFLTELEETRRHLSYEIGQVKKMVRDESRINGRQHQAIIQLVENRYNELDDRIKVANL